MNESNPVLPDEIICGEILTRLPVKSLLRFKIVCKSWQLLISSDFKFVKSHLAFNKNNCLLVRSSTSDIKHTPDSSPLLNKLSLLIGSVNGLVCLFHWFFQPKSVRNIGIWNPATKHYKQISPPIFSSNSGHVWGEFAFGFGFDSVTDDYKVIYLTTFKNQPVLVDVYSCKTDSWSKTNESSDFVYPGTLSQKRRCSIVNGCPYWLSAVCNGFTHNLISVIWFDVRHDVLRWLSAADLPPVNYQVNTIVLADFRNSPAAMIYDISQHPVNVYFYYEKASVWRKTYTVPEINMRGSPRCFWEGNILFFDNEDRLCCIDPQTRHVQSLGNITYTLIDSFCYKQSLICLNGMKPLPLNIDESRCGVYFIAK